jgi:hypothetical protein
MNNNKTTTAYDHESNRILVGDVRTKLAEIPDASIDTIITSPPYFRLRNYQHAEQLGLEATVDAFVDELRMVAKGLHRVLKPTGSLWLNLGDTYARNPVDGAPKKNLLLVPERVALALQADGWYFETKSSGRSRIQCQQAFVIDSAARTRSSSLTSTPSECRTNLTVSGAPTRGSAGRTIRKQAGQFRVLGVDRQPMATKVSARSKPMAESVMHLARTPAMSGRLRQPDTEVRITPCFRRSLSSDHYLRRARRRSAQGAAYRGCEQPPHLLPTRSASLFGIPHPYVLLRKPVCAKARERDEALCSIRSSAPEPPASLQRCTVGDGLAWN